MYPTKSVKFLVLGAVSLVLVLSMCDVVHAWSDWSSLTKPKGLKFVSYPVVGRNQDGRLEVFGEGSDGAIWHVYQSDPGKGPWSGWGSLSKPSGVKLSYPVAERNKDGRLEVFATDYGAIWHVHQSAPNKGPWSGWGSLGKPSGVNFITRPVVGQNQDGRLEVFATGSDRVLWHVYQSAPNKGPWIGWGSLGKPSGVKLFGLAVGRNQDGRLEVFGEGSDGAIWHVYQSAPSKGPWSGWGSLGKPSGVKLSYPVVERNKGGHLEVFAMGSDGAIWHVYQSAPSKGPWIGWGSLGKPATGVSLWDPVAGRNQDGRLEVFATGSNGVLWHVYQSAPNKGPWIGWGSLGKPPGSTILSHPDVGHNQDGRLEVFGTSNDGALWHNWQ